MTNLPKETQPKTIVKHFNRYAISKRTELCTVRLQENI